MKADVIAADLGDSLMDLGEPLGGVGGASRRVPASSGEVAPEPREGRDGSKTSRTLVVKADVIAADLGDSLMDLGERLV